MSTVATPPPSGKKVNIIGLESTAYRGAKTTLCAGCGHNAITERIIDSFFELGVQPDQVIKLECNPQQIAKLRSIPHYYGLPIDGRSLTTELLKQEGRL